MGSYAFSKSIPNKLLRNRLGSWTSHLTPTSYLSAGEWLPELRQMPAGRNDAALTFDDGPTSETTLEILELLSHYDAVATFFLTGARAFEHPELVQAIVERRHEVYTHGWDHIRYDATGTERLIQDLERCETYLRRFRPTPSPYLVRLPYAAGHRCLWVHRALRRWNPNVQLAHYSLTLRDWLLAEGCDSREELKTKIQATLARTRRQTFLGKIVLLHEQPFDVTNALNATVAPILLRALLEQFEAQGLRTTRIAPAPRQSVLSRFFFAPNWGIMAPPAQAGPAVPK